MILPLKRGHIDLYSIKACTYLFFFPFPMTSWDPFSLHVEQPQYPLNCLICSHKDLAGASTVMSKNIPLSCWPDGTVRPIRRGKKIQSKFMLLWSPDITEHRITLITLQSLVFFTIKFICFKMCMGRCFSVEHQMIVINIIFNVFCTVPST